MKSIIRICIFLIVVFSGCATRYTNPHIVIETKFGVIEVELYSDKAPKTVAAFLRNIDSAFYKNTSFYRVLNMDNQPSNAPKTELIQGGLWRTSKKRDYLPGIPHENTLQTGIDHKNGTISMARLAPGTATTEFFICIGNQPGLDYGGDNNPDGQGYAAFGKVVKGMDVIRLIQRKKEDDQYFDPPVNIYDIKQL